MKIGWGKSKKRDNKSTSQTTGRGRGPTRAQEKIAKRILGKDTGRHVFGFPCSKELHAEIKVKAGELQIPIFALAEHCLELGIDTISDIDDPEERDLLHKHLIEHHVNQRTLEKINWFDEELVKDMNVERLRQFEIERIARKLVKDFIKKGMNPKHIPYYLNFGYNCFYAYVRGWPMPKPPGGNNKPQRPTADSKDAENGPKEEWNENIDPSQESKE